MRVVGRLDEIGIAPLGGGSLNPSRRRHSFFLTFFSAKGDFFLVHFWKEMAFLGEVVVGEINFLNKICRFLTILTFLVHFHFALWERFWPFFRYFGIRWHFLDPRELFRRLWGNFGHFS